MILSANHDKSNDYILCAFPANKNCIHQYQDQAEIQARESSWLN